MRAARRSASFHAAATSSVVPRTPRSHSCAMAALWSTRPTTRAPIAIPVKRCALIDDRHQGQAEAHDPDAARKQRLEAAPREQVNVARELLAECSIDAMRDAVGQPVDERKPCVDLDRKPSVRRGYEDATSDAE